MGKLGMSVGTRWMMRWGVVVTFVTAILVCAAAASASAQTVALWRMNESNGTTMFDSGAAPANDGTIHGDVSLGVRGIRGSHAYRFRRGYVRVPSESSLNPRRARLVVTVHANPSSLPTSGDFDVIRKGDSPALQFKMEILQSGQLSCGFRGRRRAAIVDSTKKIIPHTGYHRLRCIKNRHRIRAVVGRSVTTVHTRVGSIHNSQPVVIGAHGSGDFDFYKGKLDTIKIKIG
jgi:hypothetical protein